MVVWTPIVEMQMERGSRVGVYFGDKVVWIYVWNWVFFVKYVEEGNAKGEMKIRIALRNHTHSTLVQIYMLNAQVSMKA